MVTGLKFGQQYYDDLLAKYTHKRQLMCEGLDTIGLKHNVPEGAYYIMIDVREFMKKTGLTDDYKFAELLCERVGVGTVPGSSFFAPCSYNQKSSGEQARNFAEPVNDYVRIHFAKYRR